MKLRFWGFQTVLEAQMFTKRFLSVHSNFLIQYHNFFLSKKSCQNWPQKCLQPYVQITKNHFKGFFIVKMSLFTTTYNNTKWWYQVLAYYEIVCLTIYYLICRVFAKKLDFELYEITKKFEWQKFMKLISFDAHVNYSQILINEVILLHIPIL